jgi:8-oxo-dGTP pyrophosphatase MutT (NUDIX family)
MDKPMAAHNSRAAISHADMPKGSRAGPPLSPIPRQWAPRAATAAIIVLNGRDYVLQLRDMRSDIWYPGHWGLFGGQNLPGEAPEASIRRELVEELGFEPPKLCVFAEMAFGFSFATGQLSRVVFETYLDRKEFRGLKLQEGSAMRVFRAFEINGALPIVPCDRFVLDLHIHRSRGA